MTITVLLLAALPGGPAGDLPPGAVDRLGSPAPGLGFAPFLRGEPCDQQRNDEHVTHHARGPPFPPLSQARRGGGWVLQERIHRGCHRRDRKTEQAQD